ncbi:MAG: cytochrome C [Anaerolineae bacterium]|nr:MAG: cytochrome C [Anaerolineae bacterium]
MAALAERFYIKSSSFTWLKHLIIPGLLLVSVALLLGSISYPYWTMHLDAPQYDYRDGLNIEVYINEMKGKDPEFDELRELNNLNHYIGMRQLDDAAEFERSIAIPSLLIFIVLLVVAAVAFLRNYRYAWLLTLPPFAFPFVFVADLYYWLRDSGQNLDPAAPFSSSIKPFTPTMIGEGVVGQFSTAAQLGTGWYLALGASLCIVAVWGILIAKSFTKKA